MVKSYPTDDEATTKKSCQPTPDQIQRRLIEQAQRLAFFARDPRAGDDEVTLWQFEKSIRAAVFQIGCTAVALFLACCEERIRRRTTSQLVSHGRRFQRRSPKARTIMTWFGSVTYWRTYMAQQGIAKGEGQGFFPLDLQLGLRGLQQIPYSVVAGLQRPALRRKCSTMPLASLALFSSFCPQHPAPLWDNLFVGGP